MQNLWTIDQPVTFYIPCREYLGYSNDAPPVALVCSDLLTDIQPVVAAIEAILHMEPPSTPKGRLPNLVGWLDIVQMTIAAQL